MFILIFTLQITGVVEIIPPIHAITSIEESIDIPIPLQSIDIEDSFSIQRSESNFYEEIADEEDPSSDEIPTILPGWSNKGAAKCRGLLIGFLGGLAARIYFFALPDAGFNCHAWRNTDFYINDFLRNLF